MEEDRRLIEDTIPIKKISEESAEEKSIRHGHISTLHIWWARRPLIASRAVIFSSLVRNPETEEAQRKLIKQLIELSTWKASTDIKIIDRARKTISCDFENKPKVLDCFAGGGSIPLEALRLGCDTYALELNPVAYIIELCTLFYPQKYGIKESNKSGIIKDNNSLLRDFEKWGKWVLEKSREEIGNFYQNDPDGSIPVAYLWARAIRCPNPSCGVQIPLVRTTVLDGDNGQFSISPQVDVNTKEVHFEVSSSKSSRSKQFFGTMRRDSAKCISCGQTADGRYIRREGKAGRMGEIPLAVVLIDRRGSKQFRTFTPRDLSIYRETYSKLRILEKRWNEDFGQSLIPNEKIIEWSGVFNPPLYGLDEWRKLFNNRQVLALATFMLNIKDVYREILRDTKNSDYARAVTTYLALALDRLADYESTLCVWAGGFVAHTFGRGALPMVWDYAEVNPFSNSTGSWQSALGWIKRVIEHCSMITESAKVLQGTATRLPFGDKYFDAVVTDPPYYNAVPYSDLSDFFYVWLKRTIGDLYPDVFRTPLAPKTLEIVQNPMRHGNDDEKAKAFYEKEMTRAFLEVRRVLKDNGIFVVVFAHKTTSAWETLVNSLLNSGFIVTASWPIHTERPGRLRAHESAALASSIFLVCRKHLEEKEGYFDEIKEELRVKITEKLDEFWHEGIRGADFFISAIGPAVEVFGKYSKVRKLSGEEVTAAVFLDTVREIVTDYSLRKILHESHLGNIDEITRFYVLWRWAYNNLEIDFDDARKLAQALGAEADELMGNLDLLQKKGEKVRLLGPKERANIRDLGEVRGDVPRPMIDVIHHSCVLWEKGGKDALQEYLSLSGHAGNEITWNVAQALSEILPEGDKEKQLIQGLLASKESMTLPAETANGQTRLTSFGGHGQ
jgi:adenine-specific DNA methylase